MNADEELLTFQRFLLAFDTPAYLRRARQVEAEWRHLLTCCDRERERLLELPKLRLGQLFAAVGGPAEAGRLPVSEGERMRLVKLLEEWQPRLRAAVLPARTAAQVEEHLARLIIALERFNGEWERFLCSLDLGPINRLREGYNRYYVIEKECAVRSVRTAREGFEPLPPVTTDDLRRLFPPLAVPVLIVSAP